MIQGETVTDCLANGAQPNPHISPFQVMESAAGHYVGTTFITCDKPDCKECRDDGLPPGFAQPNSRETGYMSEARAKEVLAEMLAGEKPRELRTPAFNEAAVTQLHAIEFPADITGAELYKLIHGEDC